MFKSLIKNVLLKASVFAFLIDYRSHLSIVVFGHLCCGPRMKMLQLCVVFVVDSAPLPLHSFVVFIIIVVVIITYYIVNSICHKMGAEFGD